MGEWDFLPSSSVTSLTVISHPYVAGEFIEAAAEFNDNPDFRQALTYSRFVLQSDPITGGLDKSSSTDYTIYGDVQIMDVENKLVEAGYLAVGDALIFLPARIQKDTNGDAIDNEFRPQIQDEVTQAGVTYKIDKIEFVRYGETEIFAKCMAKRRKNTQPERIWNPNYSDTFDMGGGYT